MWGDILRTSSKENCKTSAPKPDHSDPIFANLEFLKIDDIRQLQLLSFAYDCQNKLVPVHFYDYFVPCSHV